MSTKQCSATIGSGVVTHKLEDATPRPCPITFESSNKGTQHGPRATTMPTPGRTVLDERGRRYTAKQFQSKNELSTFICTLVIAYIAYITVGTDVQRRNLAFRIPYNFGIFLAILAIQAHGISIVLSSQRVALCNNFSKECTEEALQHTLAVCSSLQFAGTTCLILAVMGSSCLFFDHVLYVVLFFIFSLAGVVALMYGNGELARMSTNVLGWRTLIMRVPNDRNPEA